MGALMYLACPFELPYGKISVAMKAEKDAGCRSRIPDDETNQRLPVLSLVLHPPGFGRGLIQSGRLKENSLLGPPKEEQEGEQQSNNDDRANHVSTLRGFQWVCMAGNLRQCEFR